MKRIYLDHAATTPVAPAVLKAMSPYFNEYFGNPSESHQWGQSARAAVEQAREKIAIFLGAKISEIIFTSGATEAINLAHKGLIEIKYRDQKDKIPHVITSSIEHKAAIESCKHLEKIGWTRVTYLPVDKNGLISIKELEKSIRPETILVSIMYVNNEMGSIQPIPQIGRLIEKINNSRISSSKSKIYFHSDVTQATQYLNCDVNYLGVDLLSLSGHKVYSPKGVGVLYFKKDTPLIRQQDGGEQEFRLRAGTENVPYLVGLSKAIELIQQGKEQNVKVVSEKRDKLIDNILKISGVKLVGDPTKNAPHIATFLVKDVEGEAMMLLLSEEGIAVSSGSACTSGLLEPSHVLLAMGYNPQETHGSLRFSLGQGNTEKEIDYVIKVLPKIIKNLRRMAPKL